jgi:hypothetical protein
VSKRQVALLVGGREQEGDAAFRQGVRYRVHHLVPKVDVEDAEVDLGLLSFAQRTLHVRHGPHDLGASSGERILYVCGQKEVVFHDEDPEAVKFVAHRR